MKTKSLSPHPHADGKSNQMKFHGPQNICGEHFVIPLNILKNNFFGFILEEAPRLRIWLQTM